MGSLNGLWTLVPAIRYWQGERVPVVLSALIWAALLVSLLLVLLIGKAGYLAFRVLAVMATQRNKPD